jgi:hypothetical protein
MFSDDVKGMYENELPTFWSEQVSKSYGEACQMAQVAQERRELIDGVVELEQVCEDCSDELTRRLAGVLSW